MRKPAFGNARQQSSGDVREIYLPAPTLGLSDNQAKIAADPRYARNIRDFWPLEQGLLMRPGRILWASRPGIGEVKSLATYPGASGTPEMWAITNSGIYNATVSGVMPAAALALGVTTLPWSWVNFTNSAGTVFLVGTHGLPDGPKTYNGAAWTVPAITGVTSLSALWYVWSFKRRLFYLSQSAGEGMYAWYLPVDSIQGEAKKFPVGPNFPRGGKLVSGGSWTLDGGNGPDDYCFFITDQGEIAVYEGIDPSTADSFALVGVFYVGKIGLNPRCWVREGADVLISSMTGIYSLTAIARAGQAIPAKSETEEISIRWVMFQNNASIGGSPPYQLAYYAPENMLLAYSVGQFAQNRKTGAWTLFTLGGVCFVEFSTTIPFGNTAWNLFLGYGGSADGEIYRVGGKDDNGDPIFFIVENAPVKLVKQGNAVVQQLKFNWGVGYSAIVAATSGFDFSYDVEMDGIGQGSQSINYWNKWCAAFNSAGQNLGIYISLSSKLFYNPGSYDPMNIFYGTQVQYRVGSSSMP